MLFETREMLELSKTSIVFRMGRRKNEIYVTELYVGVAEPA